MRSPASMNKFAQGWLDSQCQTIEGVSCALLLLNDPARRSFQLIAQLPHHSRAATELIPIAETAIKKQHKAINAGVTGTETSEHSFDYLALPIFSQTILIGVIAMKMAHRTKAKQQEVSDFLENSTKWIEPNSFKENASPNFYASIVQLAAGCFEQDTYTAASNTVITQLSSSLSCERVSMGRLNRHHIQVTAISNSASFDPRSNIIRAIANAMDEAVDQDSIIVYSSDEKSADKVSRAHVELARKFGTGSICTIPLIHNQTAFGALTLERSKECPFSAETIRLCEQTAALIGPFLELKQQDEKGLIEKIWDSLTSGAKNFLGLNHLGMKISLILLALITGYGAVVESDFQVKADAVLEGRIQREIVVSIDGYIATARYRAGDVVKKEDVLATLDDKDLKLERLQVSSRYQQITREYREAMANGDRVKVRVLSAGIEQHKAELELIDEQLERTRIKVPFDGIIIEGDLSQSLGSPVERGDALFKIAPLDDYRIVLTVDERLIAYVSEGQEGILALSSLPERRLSFTIGHITTVANVEDGYNAFRVDAALKEAFPVLRPGMQGIGKIDAGRAKLIWIWTHELVDWVRLWFWSWWP